MRTVVKPSCELGQGVLAEVVGKRANPRGKGAKRSQSPLSREAVLRFLEAARPHVEWLEYVQQQMAQNYEQSCREQIRLRTVVKPGYVKFEIVMRPGKPDEQCLELARKIKARLDYMRQVLERNGLASGPNESKDDESRNGG